MPIIVFYRNGQHEVFQSRDERGLLDYRYLELTTGDGHKTSVFKEDVRRVEFYPDDKWAKEVEEAKKKHDEQVAAQAEQKKKDDEEKARKDTEAQAEKDRVAEFVARPWWKKILRDDPRIKFHAFKG